MGVAPSFNVCDWGTSLETADVAMGAAMVRMAATFWAGFSHPRARGGRSMAEFRDAYQ